MLKRKERTGIVFLCDGENDQETIQLAIDYGGDAQVFPSR